MSFVLHNEGEVPAISENLLRRLEVGPLAKKVALRSDDTVCSLGLHRCCWQLAAQSHGQLLVGDLLFNTSQVLGCVGDIIPCWQQVSLPFKTKASGLARSLEASPKCVKH